MSVVHEFLQDAGDGWNLYWERTFHRYDIAEGAYVEDKVSSPHGTLFGRMTGLMEPNSGE